MKRSTMERNLLAEVMVERAREEAGEAPTELELLDYLIGDLPPEAEERVRRHLVSSPDSRARLREIRPFARGLEPRTGEDVADFETLASWRDLKARLAQSSQAGLPAAKSTHWISAVAASLLVATLGLSAWVWQLRGERMRPVANLKTLQLIDNTRGQPARETLELLPGMPFRLAIYLPEPPAGCEDFEIEIRESDGQGRSTVGGLRIDQGRLSVLLRGDPGLYELTLYGCGDRVSELTFEVVAAER